MADKFGGGDSARATAERFVGASTGTPGGRQAGASTGHTAEVGAGASTGHAAHRLASATSGHMSVSSCSTGNSSGVAAGPHHDVERLAPGTWCVALHLYSASFVTGCGPYKYWLSGYQFASVPFYFCCVPRRYLTKVGTNYSRHYSRKLASDSAGDAAALQPARPHGDTRDVSMGTLGAGGSS
jgi:hypothetical protein